MPLPLLLATFLALAPPEPPALVSVHPTQKAVELLNAGKVPEALAQLDLAIARDPKDAQPLWIKAQVFQELAKRAQGWPAAWYRECAEEAGEAMLDLPNLDRHTGAQALSLLQHLRDSERPAPPQPPAVAQQAFEAGEAAFGREAWEEARAGYAKALEACPTFAKAALYLGDAYFAEHRLDEAIRWFQRAAELDPADPRAWRYMADAQSKAGRDKEAEATMIAAIRVSPANRASWYPLVQLRLAQGRPMTRLRFKPGVSVSWTPEGKLILGLTQEPADPEAQAAWMLLASAILDEISIIPNGVAAGTGAPPASRFQKERLFWDLALTMYEENCRDAKREPQDPVLRQFLRFKKEGHLDAALFLLRYREAFRPDYEAWQKAHPRGIESFVNRYNLRP